MSRARGHDGSEGIRVRLAWELEDLAPLAPGDWVLPLTAATYMAVRSTGQLHLDASELLGSLHELERQALGTANALHASLRAQRQGWLEAYANVAFGMQAFQFTTWLQLLRRLHERIGPQGVVVLPASLLGIDARKQAYMIGLAQDALRIASGVVRREGLRIESDLPATAHGDDGIVRSLRARLRRVAAALCAVSAGMLSARWYGALGPAAMGSRQGPVGILLVTQQSHDAVHGQPLAIQLRKRFGGAFCWMSRRSDAQADLTTEEASLRDGTRFDDAAFIDTAALYQKLPEGGLRMALLDASAAWQVAGVLSDTQPLGVRRGEWFELLRGQQYRGLTARYRVWEGALDHLKPSLVVGLSALQDMALVRAWARRRKVPFVMFMHGAFPWLRRSHDLDADRIGVFGERLTQPDSDPALPRPQRIVACGPMQFADKSRAPVGALAPGGPRGDVLFLGSFEALPFAPLALEDQWRMLEDLHRACAASGRHLRLRLHPRYPHTAWSPFVEELARRMPDTISISDEPSIKRDLARSVCAVAYLFDGALVDAMLQGAPVISYLPGQSGCHELSRTLDSTGGLVADCAALESLLRAADHAPEPWGRLRDVQRRFLEEYLGTAGVNPWDRATDLVGELAGSARARGAAR